MRREIFEDAMFELDKIDAYIVNLGKKYGSFVHEGKQFDCYCTELEDIDWDGQTEWTGWALCTDEITIDEWADDSLDYIAQSYIYKRNSNRDVVDVHESDYLYWKGDHFEGLIKDRKVC